MIKKELGRKSINSAPQLYDYIGRDKDVAGLFLHNLHGHSRDQHLKQFQSNAQLLSKRKGANYFYHVMISLALNDVSKDRQVHILEHTAGVYMDLRGKNHLAYGRVHAGEYCHIHLIVSANELNSNRRSSLTKKQYASLQKKLEKYIQKTFPELKQESIYVQEGKSENISDKEYQTRKRGTTPMKKDAIRHLVEDCIELADSKESFLEAIRFYKLDSYERGQNTVIIDEDNKKYRLKTLGGEELQHKYNILVGRESKQNEQTQGQNSKPAQKATGVPKLKSGYQTSQKDKKTTTAPKKRKETEYSSKRSSQKQATHNTSQRKPAQKQNPKPPKQTYKEQKQSKKHKPRKKERKQAKSQKKKGAQKTKKKTENPNIFGELFSVFIDNPSKVLANSATKAISSGVDELAQNLTNTKIKKQESVYKEVDPPKLTPDEKQNLMTHNTPPWELREELQEQNPQEESVSLKDLQKSQKDKSRNKDMER